MTARLFCRTGQLAGAEYQIGEEATIGRDEQNDVTLPSDAVSDRHARIFFDEEAERYVLEDLDSRHGTYLDATEVVDPVPLRDLHIITFAEEVDFIFQAVAEDVVASSTEEGAKTQFGTAPQAPTGLSEEEEAADGERTQFGGAPGALPDLSDENSAEERTEESSEGERTRFGEAPPDLPDLSDEAQEGADEDRTRFGDSPPDVPNVFGEDEPEAERTQYGDAPEELPDLSGEDASSAKEEEQSEEEDRTRFGESPPELPDLSEEDDGGDEPEDERTQFEGTPGALPDLPGEDDSSDRDEGPSGEDEGTRIGDAPDALPDLPEGESTSEEETSGEEEPPSEAPTQAVPSESSPQYALQVILDTGPEETHPLSEGEVTIGRSPDCDVQIDDPGVSRQHARLTVKSGGVVVEDMGSKNFTFIDGERLSGPTALSPGSEIQFGLQAKAVLQRISA